MNFLDVWTKLFLIRPFSDAADDASTEASNVSEDVLDNKKGMRTLRRL